MVTVLKVHIIHDRIGNTFDDYSHHLIAEWVEKALKEKTDSWKETRDYGNPITVTVVKEESHS